VLNAWFLLHFRVPRSCAERYTRRLLVSRRNALRVTDAMRTVWRCIVVRAEGIMDFDGVIGGSKRPTKWWSYRRCNVASLIWSFAFRCLRRTLWYVLGGSRGCGSLSLQSSLLSLPPICFLLLQRALFRWSVTIMSRRRAIVVARKLTRRRHMSESSIRGAIRCMLIGRRNLG